MSDISIPCTMYRGGTSRGLLFLEEHLPYPREVLAKMLLRMFGSPDPRQIDGVGGATSLTSKALIVGPDHSPDADVRMTFAQVGVAVPTVDWGGNCGNMTTAVGPFAMESGLVAAVEPVTIVKIRSANTGVLVHAHVPVRNGEVLEKGDYAIAGVPGRAARIDLEWLNPGGTTTGRLLPTGRAIDRLILADGRHIDASIVDAGNPVVFCEAAAIGLAGDEPPSAIEAQSVVMQTLEEIRSIAAELIGIVPDRAMGTRTRPGLPKVACVAQRSAYRTTNGEAVPIEAHDLNARLLSMQTVHRAYGGGAAICTASAALVPGTIVHGCRSKNPADPNTVRIGHPAGVMDVLVTMQTENSEPHVLSATVGRTARRILSGAAWLPEGW